MYVYLCQEIGKDDHYVGKSDDSSPLVIPIFRDEAGETIPAGTGNDGNQQPTTETHGPLWLPSE